MSFSTLPWILAFMFVLSGADSSTSNVWNIRLTSVTKLASGRHPSRESVGAKIASAQKKDFQSVALEFFSRAAETAPTLIIDVTKSDPEHLYLYCDTTGKKFRISRRDIIREALGAGPSLSELLSDTTPSTPARRRSLAPNTTSTSQCLALNYSGRCAPASTVTLWSQAEASWRATLNYSFFVHAQQLPAPAGTIRIIAAVPADPMAAFRQRFQAFFQLSGYASFLQSLTPDQYGAVGFQARWTSRSESVRVHCRFTAFSARSP